MASLRGNKWLSEISKHELKRRVIQHNTMIKTQTAGVWFTPFCLILMQFLTTCFVIYLFRVSLFPSWFYRFVGRASAWAAHRSVLRLAEADPHSTDISISNKWHSENQTKKIKEKECIYKDELQSFLQSSWLTSSSWWLNDRRSCSDPVKAAPK